MLVPWRVKLTKVSFINHHRFLFLKRPSLSMEFLLGMRQKVLGGIFSKEVIFVHWPPFFVERSGVDFNCEVDLKHKNNIEDR